MPETWSICTCTEFPSSEQADGRLPLASMPTFERVGDSLPGVSAEKLHAPSSTGAERAEETAHDAMQPCTSSTGPAGSVHWDDCG